MILAPGLLLALLDESGEHFLDSLELLLGVQPLRRGLQRRQDVLHHFDKSRDNFWNYRKSLQ